jgi:hypothetical protein
MSDPKHDIATWNDTAKRCHAHAANEAEAAERELTEGLTPHQRELLDTILRMQRQADEIVQVVDLEAVAAHLSDPARIFRALFDHVVNGDGELATCCAGLPALPFEEHVSDA